MRRSITARYDALERRGAELAGVIPTVSPVHEATVNVMTDLLALGQMYSTGDTPPHLRAMMRMLDKSRPMLLESLAGIPGAQIKVFIAELIARMQVIVDTPTPDESGEPSHDVDGGAGDPASVNIATG